MYKLLLCWRYLLTRYLALASIISVMLGVATLIVVNAVMGGFSTKLIAKMKGLNSDVVIEHISEDGMDLVDARIERVKQMLGDKLVAITPVIETFAILEFNLRRYGEPITTSVRVIGIDPLGKSATGDFRSALINPENRKDPTKAFTLHGKALEVFREGFSLPPAALGFGHTQGPPPPVAAPPDESGPPPGGPPAATPPTPPGAGAAPLPAPAPARPPEEFSKPYCAVVGWGIAKHRRHDAKVTDADMNIEIISPGHEISLTLLGATTPEGYGGQTRRLRPTLAKFVVSDLFRFDMAEFDGKVIFIDLRDMQTLRALGNRAKSLHLKLRDYEKDSADVVRLLKEEGVPEERQLFPAHSFYVQTWMERQGTLLGAVAVERAILNVLLFMIIAVAGFGILAIFFMIVVEKTKDIGILKALGAPSRGVANIFIGYGLILGLVGAGLGTLLGVAITVHLDDIERVLTWLTNRQMFPRDIYYFDKIPTDLSLWMILWVNLGSLGIAVAASVFPALRAAMLNPVQALRYE
jgi:lipoprotein-releasing system permease protein